MLGYDVADISGSVSLTLTLTLGLDNSNPDAVIPFSQAVDDLALTIDAKLSVGISASVLGFSVFSYNLSKDYGNIVNTITHGIFLTDPPSMAPGDFIGPGGGPAIEPADGPTAVISTGSSLVEAYTVDPSPQIVINPSNGMALSAQVTNVGSANAPQGNLVVASRANSNSGWSTGTALPENNDVANPVLALTNDGSQGSTPAVVVYDVDDASGSPSTQTLNQRLDSSDIAYRYFNGTSWGSEIRLTSDSLYDSEQSVAFDSSGAGVLAYVHNTDSAPIGITSGVYDDASNDIYASTWNKTTSGLAANSSGTAQFNITIPAGAGDDVYTAVLNSSNSIAESNYNNNESRFELVFLADPAVYNAGTGAVVATLLNSNVSNNVQVVVNVENLGAVSLFNLPIDLQDSRNGGPLTSDGQMVIPELDPGVTAAETFTVSALGGDNVFVGSIDSSVYPEDSNLANDSGSADLYVPGLPTLSATLSLSSGTTPVGGALTLTANVSNSGTADATAVPYLVLASLTSGGPSYIVGSGTGNPAAQSVQTTPISLNTAGLAPGAYTLTFEIDPNQTVVQGSEAGNIATIAEFLTGGVTLTGAAEYWTSGTLLPTPVHPTSRSCWRRSPR